MKHWHLLIYLKMAAPFLGWRHKHRLSRFQPGVASSRHLQDEPRIRSRESTIRRLIEVVQYYPSSRANLARAPEQRSVV